MARKPNNQLPGEVADDILQSILATPKRQRRLLSSTFWKKFGAKKRTTVHVEEVREALRRRSIMMDMDEAAFGTESKGAWLTLSYVEQPPPPPPHGVDVPTPPDAWFERMRSRVLKSEREVEHFFVRPLLEQLGYQEDDMAIGYPVVMSEGVKKVTKQADFVLFDGLGCAQDDVLLIVEAKGTSHMVTPDAVRQARAYAMWLSPTHYLVTNGKEVHVYLFQGSMRLDVLLMKFDRSELKDQWSELYLALNRKTVLAFKKTRQRND